MNKVMKLRFLPIHLKWLNIDVERGCQKNQKLPKSKDVIIKKRLRKYMEPNPDIERILNKKYTQSNLNS
jgi:hypothetical protein